MLLSVFILLAVLSVTFFVLMIYWKSIAIGISDVVLWLYMAINVYQIEIPYQLMKSDDTVATGTQIIEGLYPLSWFFMGMAVISMLYLFSSIILPMLQQKFTGEM